MIFLVKKTISKNYGSAWLITKQWLAKNIFLAVQNNSQPPLWNYEKTEPWIEKRGFSLKHISETAEKTLLDKKNMLQKILFCTKWLSKLTRKPSAIQCLLPLFLNISSEWSDFFNQQDSFKQVNCNSYKIIIWDFLIAFSIYYYIFT